MLKYLPALPTVQYLSICEHTPGNPCDWVCACVCVWKADGLGGGCGGLPAVRGGFQPDTAGFSRLQRGGVHLYGGLCWAANSPRKVKAETRSTERKKDVVCQPCGWTGASRQQLVRSLFCRCLYLCCEALERDSLEFWEVVPRLFHFLVESFRRSLSFLFLNMKLHQQLVILDRHCCYREIWH